MDSDWTLDRRRIAPLHSSDLPFVFLSSFLPLSFLRQAGLAALELYSQLTSVGQSVGLSISQREGQWIDSLVRPLLGRNDGARMVVSVHPFPDTS